MKRVLITGIKGMAGSHLLDYLVKLGGFDIWGNDKEEAEDFIEADRSMFNYMDCDIRFYEEVSKLFQIAEPDWVFHLAAEPFVPNSWSDPSFVVEENVIGTVHILECSRQMDKMPLVQIGCSSEEYGMVYPEEVPINHKTQPFRPMSTYGVSKVADELLGKQYGYSYGLKCILTRTFNHTGPRQKDFYVTSGFVLQALEVLSGLRPKIRHGNLESVRDFTDVRDIVRAYVMAMKWLEQTGVPGQVMQLGGGAVLSMQNVLEMVCDLADLSLGEATELDESRNRPSDVPLLCCDSTQFKLLTGWAPARTYQHTIADVFKYWSEKKGLKLPNNETLLRLIEQSNTI